MGAKTQANLKESNDKRPALRCDDCERDFLTLSALKSHTMAKHPEKYKQMQSSATEEKKTAFVPPTSRASRRLQQKQSTEKEVSTTNRKTIFQCPKCVKEFSVLFPAIRHIRNRHCVDAGGNPVSPHSSDLIKPICKEICLSCDKSHPIDVACDKAEDQQSDKGSYRCLACKEMFRSIVAFDEHVEKSHYNSVTSVSLGSQNDFQNWKSKVEAKQRVKYLSLSNATSKQYYQCNFVSTQNSANVTHLCPSIMMVREFTKRIHVKFFKEHHGHHCDNSIVENDKTKVTTNKSPEEKFEEVLKSGADINFKLHNMLKSIGQRVTALKRDKLKPLYISALKMQSYLDSLVIESTPLKVVENNLKTEDENKNEVKNEVPKKNMTDAQILKALEGTRASARLKRKSVGSPTPEPKNKILKKDEPKGLKENNSQIDLACAERFESPRPNLSSPFTQSPSFNDTYKQFLEVTSPRVETLTPTEKPKRAKKEIVKTKIGQFTPSPKKATPEKIETENISVKKKKKTKSSPLSKIKLEDVDYEVVEQENDCNILILKI